MAWPASAVAGPVFETATSALALTVTVPVLRLFAPFGSPVVELMLAFKPIEPAAFGAIELIVITVVAPDAKEAAVQVAVFAVFEHVKAGLELVALLIVPCGWEMLMVVDAAALGPPLAAFSVHVTGCAALTGFGAPVGVATERSAAGLTVTLAVEVLFPRLGSDSVAETVPVFVSGPGAPAAFKTTVTNSVAPFAIDGQLHVNGLDAPTQLPAPVGA